MALVMNAGPANTGINTGIPAEPILPITEEQDKITHNLEVLRDRLGELERRMYHCLRPTAPTPTASGSNDPIGNRSPLHESLRSVNSGLLSALDHIADITERMEF